MIEPMKAVLADKPFSDPNWIFERKLDGIRCLATRDASGVQLVSQYAPNIDRISVTPLVASTGALSVATTSTTRCVAGKVVLTTTAKNTGSSPVDIVMTSAFGTKTFTAVAPGKNATGAFTTRQVSLAAGSVTVDSTGTVDGATLTDQQKPAYAAASCR